MQINIFHILAFLIKQSNELIVLKKILDLLEHMQITEELNDFNFYSYFYDEIDKKHVFREISTAKNDIKLNGMERNLSKYNFMYVLCT